MVDRTDLNLRFMRLTAAVPRDLADAMDGNCRA
jgi:hypothetical protein